jgi:hypothetical protein
MSKRQQSTGRCHLCGETFRRAAMTAHLNACGQPEASSTSPEISNQASNLSFHLTIEGRFAKRYWIACRGASSRSVE